MLLGRVLVGGEAARRAGAPDVEPADGEAALLAEPLVLGGVRGREVVHAVGEGLEHDRRRQLLGQPELRCQPGSVGRRDEGAPVLHGRSSSQVGSSRRVAVATDSRADAPSGPTLPPSAPAFAPLLEGDPRVVAPGNALGRRLVAVNRALGEAGWIGMSWPVELGGRGLSRLTATLVEEVFGYHWLPLSSYLLSYKTIGAAIERFAAPALVERLLPPIARGELVFCQGFSEPGAGSDLGSLTTRAELRGDTYVVSGHKIWTSSAQLADWIYLAVRTDPRREAPRHQRPRLPGRLAGDRGADVPDARRRVPLRDVPRRRRDPRRRTSSARSTAAGTSSCTRSTSSA